MFESATLRHEIAKDAYEREVATLRTALLTAQHKLGMQKPFAVLVLIAGVEGAGKSETVNLLNEWMDPRFIETTGFTLPTEEESAHPPMWRFWRGLPPRGRIGIFFGAWHTAPIVQRVTGAIGAGEFDRRVEEILQMERMLHDEGVLLLKYWFHLSRDQQKHRLKALEKDKRNAGRVTKADWKNHRQYDEFVSVTEPFLRRTSSRQAPWMVVPGVEERYRSLFVGRHVLQALEERLKTGGPKPSPEADVPLAPAVDRLNVIRALKLSRPFSKARYEPELAQWQARSPSSRSSKA